MDRNTVFNNQIQSQITERILPKCLDRCPKHKLSLVTDISLQDCGSELVFTCNRCNKSNLNVEINEIAFSEDQYIFDNYPILPEDLRQKIKEILESTDSKQNMVDYISQYFKNLKVQVLQSISEMEEEMIIKAKGIDSFQRNLNGEYINLTKKIELRDIIFDDQNITQKSDSVKTIVQDVMERSNQIEQKLKDMIDIFNSTKDDIKSLHLNQRLYQKIETCIKSINTKRMQENIQSINNENRTYFFQQKQLEK